MYAATQAMRACNKLLHALIPCVVAYILSFGLRILLLLHACVAAYILPLFLYFLALLSQHPSTF